MVSIIISIVAFTVYVGAIWYKFGVLSSISESYYHLKGLQKSFFMLAMFSTGIPITIYAETGLLFFAGAFITFVGASPAFKEGTEGKVHVIGATGGILFGMMSMLFDYSLWEIPALFVFLALVITLLELKNRTWWIEILAFIAILTGLIINQLNT